MRRAQVSVEFILIAGVAMLVLVASTFFVFDYTRQSSDKSALTQAAYIGYTMIDQARNTYVRDGFLTITVQVPEQMTNIYVVENQTLVIDLQTRVGTFSIPFFAEVPINGTTPGLNPNQVNIPNSTQTVHSGRTKYRIENMGGWVQIRQIQ